MQVGMTRPGRLGDAPPAGSAPAASAAAAQQPPATVINQATQGHPVVVFSKVMCPHCRKAKEVLSSAGVAAETVELDQRPDGVALQDELERRNGRRTVPQVFVRGEFIGGAEELEQLVTSGQLATRLQGA